MSALVLDAAAFVAVDRGDRAMAARLQVARRSGLDLRTTGIIVAEVWRDPHGRRAELARLLRAVDVLPVDEMLGRDAGVLLGVTGTSAAADATVVAVAERGDRIVTGDAADMERLIAASGRAIVIVDC